jgi:hypothetical protein
MTMMVSGSNVFDAYNANASTVSTSSVSSMSSSNPSSNPSSNQMDIGSLYELRTKGYLSLKTLYFVKSWEDIVFFYSVEESVSLSAPKYNIPFPTRASSGAGRNNRTDVFTAPKGSFFAELDRESSTSVSSSSAGFNDPDPSTFAVLITDSSGHTKEFKPNEGDFMRSLGIKTLIEKEKTVSLKEDALILLDYAYFSIGQKAYYAPKNFGIYLLYEPKLQRMVWMKTYLSFHQLFRLLENKKEEGKENK